MHQHCLGCDIAKLAGRPRYSKLTVGVVFGAVPMTVFTLDYCIRYPACTVTEIAAKELKSVDFSESSGLGGDFISRFRNSSEAEADLE